MKNVNEKTVKVGERYIFNNLVVYFVAQIRKEMVVLQRGRGRMYQEVPKTHLLGCKLYEKAEIGV